MNHSEISSFIWGTADLLRSSFKQHEYGDIILPFTVMRRLDVVLEPTKQAVLDAAAKPLPAALRDTMLKQAAGVDFYNTSDFTMRGLLSDADGIRENLTKYVTSFSPEIADIFDKFKIFDVIKDLDDNDLLFLVVERFCKTARARATSSNTRQAAASRTRSRGWRITCSRCTMTPTTPSSTPW